MPDLWYLRKEGKDIFGPEPLEVLARWAREGRVAPEDEISSDRAVWTPAEQVQVLGMEWLLDSGNEEWFGPLPAAAYRDALRQGDVTLEARVRHSRRGEERTLRALFEDLIETAEEDIRRDVRALLEMRLPPAAHPEDETGPAADSARPDARESGDWKRMAQAVDHWQREALRWKERHERERLDAEKQQKQWRETLDTLRQSELEARRELEHVQQRIKRWEEQQRRRLDPASRTDDPAGAAGGTGLQARLVEMTDLSDRLTRNQSRLEERLLKMSHEVAALIEERNRIEQEAMQTTRTREERYEAKRREADEARTRLAQLEIEHAELLRSYRELNERFIRARQSQ